MFHVVFEDLFDLKSEWWMVDQFKVRMAVKAPGGANKHFLEMNIGVADVEEKLRHLF